MESPFGWVTFFPIPSLVSSTFAFWDIRTNLSTLVFAFVFNKNGRSAFFYCHLQRAAYPTFETSNKQSHENTTLAGRAMYRVIYALRDAQIMCA